MSTSKQTAGEYEKEIRKLKNQVKRLETSKCELMINTGNEIDRLRAYIKFITNRNSSLQSILDEIPDNKSPFPLSIGSNISNEVKSNHSPASDIGNYYEEHRKQHSITTDPGNERDERDEMKELMDKNHDIIADMENALHEFMSLKLFGVVECKCNKPKQLQFIATMDEPNMKCENCDTLYASMFSCNICNMSICGECQKYIAEMQCLKQVMDHFKYPKQFEQDNNNNNNDYYNNHDRMSQYERYEEYSYYNEYEYDDGFSVANQGNNRFHGELVKLGTQMHLKASDKLEYIFEEDLFYMTSNDFDKIDHGMCYQILDYLDDVDLCYIIDSKYSVQLLQIYWQLFEYHLTYDTQLKQFKKLRLLMDCNKWENDTLITMKDRIIKNNNVAKEYIIDNYLPTINDNRLIKPKLLYDDNNDNNNIGRIITESNNVYHNYYINEQLNEGFGTKVIKLLRIIIDNEEYNNSQITFERLKHKKYGKNNQILANGIYYIWHCHGLHRSFALQEQLFTSYQDAIDDEDQMNNNENDEHNENTNNENNENNNNNIRTRSNNNNNNNNNANLRNNNTNPYVSLITNMPQNIL